METSPLEESIESSSVTEAVRRRYAEGARQVEESLCCPVTYDDRYLKVIPAEILERDYGCGDPSRYLEEGETVLDLGCGGGKICFIASQVVGPKGRVVGVDMTAEMLDLARRHQPEVALSIGWDNIEFRRGRIEDLRLDQEQLEAWLADHPVENLAGYQALEGEIQRLRLEEPLVKDASVDVVVSNCVLNLVAPGAKHQLFGEIFRVLRRGGRAVISDIVSDREVPRELREDPELWSGCISGALCEEEFLKAFEKAGFHGIQILARSPEPWRVVAGIEFRSLTLAAWKGKQGACIDKGQSVVYLGPFRQVCDDDNHVFRRGVRTPVCDKTFQLLGKKPYRAAFARLREDGVTERDPDSLCGPKEGCC